MNENAQTLQGRIEKVFPKDRATLIIPMDHGRLLGTIPGLAAPARLLNRLAQVDGTLMSAGVAKKLAPRCTQAGLSLTLTADDQYRGAQPGKIQDIRGVLTACSVERAQAVGGDVYKLIMGWGLPDEVMMQNLQVAAQAAEAAFRAGMPLMLEPTVFLGGAKTDDQTQLLERIRQGGHAGTRGVVVGRNVWQSPDMDAMIGQLHAAIGRST